MPTLDGTSNGGGTLTGDGGGAPPGGAAGAWEVLRITTGGTYVLAPTGCLYVKVRAPGENVVLRLPEAATSAGLIIKVKRQLAGALTIVPRVGDTLEDDAGTALDIDGTGGDFACDGTDWSFT